jgi:DNA-binding IclR family transcriptional regulator
MNDLGIEGQEPTDQEVADATDMNEGTIYRQMAALEKKGKVSQYVQLRWSTVKETTKATNAT